MSGSECYSSLKNNFKDCWAEINQIIADGYVEISPGNTVPVEIFLGGDYKVRIIRGTFRFQCSIQHLNLQKLI